MCCLVASVGSGEDAWNSPAETCMETTRSIVWVAENIKTEVVEANVLDRALRQLYWEVTSPGTPESTSDCFPH